MAEIVALGAVVGVAVGVFVGRCVGAGAGVFVQNAVGICEVAGAVSGAAVDDTATAFALHPDMLMTISKNSLQSIFWLAAINLQHLNDGIHIGLEILLTQFGVAGQKHSNCTNALRIKPVGSVAVKGIRRKILSTIPSGIRI